MATKGQSNKRQGLNFNTLISSKVFVFAVHPKKSVCDLPIKFAIQDCLFSWNLTSTK